MDEVGIKIIPPSVANVTDSAVIEDILIAPLVKTQTETELAFQLLFYNQQGSRDAEIFFIRWDMSYNGKELSNLRLENISPIFQNYKQIRNIYEITENNVKCDLVLYAKSNDVQLIPENTVIFPFATMKWDRSPDPEAVGYGINSLTSYVGTKKTSRMFI